MVEIGVEGRVRKVPAVLVRVTLQQRADQVLLERALGGIEYRYVVDLGYLGIGVHHRGAGGVLHGLPGELRAYLLVDVLYLLVIWRDGAYGLEVDLPGDLHRCVRAEPALEREVALWLEVRLYAVQFHHLRERLWYIGDVGDDGALLRDYRGVGGVDALDAEVVHVPILLGHRVVAGAREASGVSARLCETGLPAAHDAGDSGLRDIEAVLVVPARLCVDDGGLRPVVVLKRVEELPRGVVYVYVLAARYRGRRAPSLCEEVDGYGSREVAGVAEERYPALHKRLLRLVPAERSA